MNQVEKLTLAVPKKIVLKAKSYAKRHGTSVSSLVTRLFRSIDVNKTDARNTEVKKEPMAAITRSSLGVISLPRKKKADLISEALRAKYLNQ